MSTNKPSGQVSFSTSAQPSGGRAKRVLFIVLGALVSLCVVCVVAAVLIIPPKRYPQQLLVFGEKGRAVGQLYHPTYISLDGQGNIYVADWNDGRINEFDPHGKYLRVIDLGSGTNILGLAVAPDGTIYISYDAVIHKLDAHGHETILSHADAKGDLLSDISGIALGADGSLAAADLSGDVLHFAKDGSVKVLLPRVYDLPSFSSRNELDPSMGSYDVQAGNADKNISVTVDGAGHIFALGWDNAVVIETDTQGNSLSKFGEPISFPGGWQRGRFNFPNSIVVDGFGRIYVGDSDAIQVFNAEHKYLFSIPISGGVDGMTMDSENNLYVIGAYPTQVIKLAALKP